MIESLICNFDTKWNIAHLCQCHGLDLQQDDSLVVWNFVSAEDRDSGLHSWPFPVTPQTAPAAMQELAGSPGWPPKHIILTCGLQSNPEWDLIASFLSSLPLISKKYIFCCADKGRPEKQLGVTSAILTGDVNFLRQFYSFRIFLEFLRNNYEILFPPGMAPCDLHIELQGVVGPLNDRVAASWFPAARWLHSQCKDLFEPREKILAEYSASIKAFLDESIQFSKQEEEPPPHENMPRASLPQASFFFRNNLAREIRKCCDEFYESPEEKPDQPSICNLLRDAYRQINLNREKMRRDLSFQGSERLKKIEDLISLPSLGLSQESVEWLQIKLMEVKDYFAMVQKRLRELLNRIPIHERDNTLKCRPLGGLTGELEIPLLEEDREVSSRRDVACRLAERLAGRQWFFGALGLSFGMGLLPPTARWWGGGIGLFSEPLDFAWIGIFVGLFFAIMSSIALWRNRALQLKLFSLGTLSDKEEAESTGNERELIGFGLKTAMDRALDKHMEALKAVHSYLRVQETLRGLVRLVALLRSRLTEMEQEIGVVQELLQFLQTQLDYYKDHFKSFGEDAMPFEFTPPHLSLQISSWLREIQKSVKGKHLSEGRGSIEVVDERFSQPDRGPFESLFLRNEARLVLRSAERKPW